MAPAWRIVEHTQTLLVGHLLVTYVQESWIENGRVQVENVLPAISPLQLSKVLLSQIHQLLVLNGASTNDYHVLTKVHAFVVLYDHLPIDSVDVLYFSEDGQAHHVFPVDIEVDVFHQGFEVVVVCCLQLLEDGVFFDFDVVVIVLGVTEHVAENVNGVRDVVFEAKHVVEGELPARVRIQLVALVLDLSLETEAIPLRRALEMKMLKEVRLARVLHFLVARPSMNKHSDGCHLGETWLSHHFDAV